MRKIREYISPGGKTFGRESSDRSPPKHPCLVALAALLPGVSRAAGAISERLIESLDQSEAAALRNFELAGQTCLAKLNSSTILALQEISKDLIWIAQEKTMVSVASNGGKLVDASSKEEMYQRSIWELFEEYDTNHDGTLSRDEFKRACLALTSCPHELTEAEVDHLVEATDINRDGRVDLHEFTVWLYSDPGSPKARSSPSKIREASSSVTEKPADVHALQKSMLKTEVEVALKQTALSDLQALQQRLLESETAISDLQRQSELELDSCLQFWCSVAKSSGTAIIENKVDLDGAEWLGNGKYGCVFKTVRHADKRAVVVKLIGIRWAHLAVGEWQASTHLGAHASIVEYDEVLLHSDDDEKVKRLIQTGFEQGKLSGKPSRDHRYLCFLEEYLNRGTVQDWMDQDILLPGGLLVVLQGVAGALAYMHGRNVTHNDVKPENIMLHQDEHSTEVQVKLGDLGAAARSDDCSKDFWQYGMTAVCMVTGERFGTRKFQKEASESFIADVSQAIDNFAGHGRLSESLEALPPLLRRVFEESCALSGSTVDAVRVSMKEVCSLPALSGWTFFDGQCDAPNTASSPTIASRQVPRHSLQGGYVDMGTVSGMTNANLKRAISKVGALTSGGQD